SMQYTHSLPTF
nr:immunoglobulin light chain junction region [Macaca mulatta]